MKKLFLTAILLLSFFIVSRAQVSDEGGRTIRAPYNQGGGGICFTNQLNHAAITHYFLNEGLIPKDSVIIMVKAIVKAKGLDKDWRLPTVKEVSRLRNVQKNLKLPNGSYWATDNKELVLVQGFRGNIDEENNKGYIQLVREIGE